MMILFLVFLIIFIAVFIKFLTADGDFTLLSKGKVKREEIEDKVIWITGASRGIGEILAKQLASLGAKLIISARNEAELQLVKKQLTGKYAPRDVMVLPLDLTSGEESLRVAVEKAESFFGASGVDYMIHNAAYDRPKSTALDVTEETLKATLNVNVVGPISLTRMLVPYMLKRGRGHLVVMSSAAGKTPAPGQAVYSASKFAVNGYFHTLRSELCRKGIKVTVVCPGPVETPNPRTGSTELTLLKLYIAACIIRKVCGADNCCCHPRYQGSLDILPACTYCYVLGAVYAIGWLLAYGQDWWKTCGSCCRERQHIFRQLAL